jgi:hypothetical protein
MPAVSHRVIQVSPRECVLNPNNQRIFSSYKDCMKVEETLDKICSHQDSILKLLLKRFKVKPLMSSFRREGFLAGQQPILGCPVYSEDKKRVGILILEGNRRIAALQSVLNDPRMYESLSPAVQTSLSAIPVQVFEVTNDDPINARRALQDAVEKMLSKRHVTGLLPWDAYETAINVRRLYRDGLDVKQIFEELSVESQSDVNRRLRTAILLEQILEHSTYTEYEKVGFDELSEKPAPNESSELYSHVQEAAMNPSLQKWLGIAPPGSSDPRAEHFRATTPGALEDFIRLICATESDSSPGTLIRVLGGANTYVRRFGLMMSKLDASGKQAAVEQLLQPDADVDALLPQLQRPKVAPNPEENPAEALIHGLMQALQALQQAQVAVNFLSSDLGQSERKAVSLLDQLRDTLKRVNDELEQLTETRAPQSQRFAPKSRRPAARRSSEREKAGKAQPRAKSSSKKSR